MATYQTCVDVGCDNQFGYRIDVSGNALTLTLDDHGNNVSVPLTSMEARAFLGHFELALSGVMMHEAQHGTSPDHHGG